MRPRLTEDAKNQIDKPQKNAQAQNDFDDHDDVCIEREFTRQDGEDLPEGQQHNSHHQNAQQHAEQAADAEESVWVPDAELNHCKHRFLTLAVRRRLTSQDVSRLLHPDPAFRSLPRWIVYHLLPKLARLLRAAGLSHSR